MQAVIIAAGESSRFWPLNKDHKSLLKILGKPLIYWTIKGLAESGIKDIVVVCRPNSAIPGEVGDGKELGATIFYVYQEQSLGTGNALWQAKDHVTEPFFVMWPNKVNSREIVSEMRLNIEQEGAEAVLVGAETHAPWDYGVLKLNGSSVEGVVENPKPGTEPSNIKAIGAYFFKEDFFSYYAGLTRHHEADFIDAINYYLKEKTASVVILKEDVPALKYPWEVFSLMDILFKTSLRTDVASSAKLEEGVIARNFFSIGENTIIRSGTIIEGPCFIGANCDIGPHNVIRGPVSIGDNVKTGAFCEIKRSIIQEGAHLHSGYMGNSIVGKNCHFGAGFVTANRRFDRKNVDVVIKGQKIDTKLSSLGAVIGDNTHFGVHSATMPGVLIGSDCTIGPGVQVFENVQDGLTKK